MIKFYTLLNCGKIGRNRLKICNVIIEDFSKENMDDKKWHK